MYIYPLDSIEQKIPYAQSLLRLPDFEILDLEVHA